MSSQEEKFPIYLIFNDECPLCDNRPDESKLEPIETTLKNSNSNSTPTESLSKKVESDNESVEAQEDSTSDKEPEPENTSIYIIIVNNEVCYYTTTKNDAITALEREAGEILDIDRLSRSLERYLDSNGDIIYTIYERNRFLLLSYDNVVGNLKAIKIEKE